MKSRNHQMYTLVLFMNLIFLIQLIFAAERCFAQSELNLSKLDTLAKQVAVIEIQHEYLHTVAGQIYHLDTQIVVDKIDPDYLKTLPELITCIEDTNGRFWNQFKVYRYFQFNIDHPPSNHLVLDKSGSIFFLEASKGNTFNLFSKNLIKRIKSKDEAIRLAMLYNSTINYTDYKRDIITETNLSEHRKQYATIDAIKATEANHEYNITMFTVDTVIIDANNVQEEILEHIFKISNDAQVKYHSKTINVRKIPNPVWKEFKK